MLQYLSSLEKLDQVGTLFILRQYKSSYTVENPIQLHLNVTYNIIISRATEINLKQKFVLSADETV